MGRLHCLNVGCADCSIIKADDGATFLIDCHNIEDHAALLPSTKKLRGVFITHQHHDHYSGLEYLQENGYSIDCLVYSPYKRRRGDISVTLDEWNEFDSYKEYFKKKGTSLHAPFRQSNWKEPYSRV